MPRASPITTRWMGALVVLATRGIGCSDVEAPPVTSPTVLATASVAAPPATALLASATAKASAAAPIPGTGPHTFDGFRLGSDFGVVVARPPFAKFCDEDPVAHRTRRMVLYGTKPCGGNIFPDSTSVIFLLAFSDGADKLAQPIEALVWMGGAYFDSRTSFPSKPGDSVTNVVAALGAPTGELVIEDGNLGLHGRRTGDGVTLTVRKHAIDVRSIALDDKAVGFVVGPMPEDPDDEQWRMIAQIYRRYVRGDG